MVTRKWSHLYIIRALADARPSDIPVWGQMRGCLEGHSLCSYLNTAAGQGLSQALETSLFLVGLGGRDGGRTEATFT